MFGCCGFLSFSLVFCRFGGWFETTLYIHFIRNRVISRRHSSAPRKSGRGKKAKKSAILRSWALWGRIVNRPVQLTSSHTYWTSLPLAQCVYRLSDGDYGSPPRFCAGRRRGDDAFVHLHDANLGVVVNGVELDQPYCRAVEECVEDMLRDYGREVERLR